MVGEDGRHVRLGRKVVDDNPRSWLKRLLCMGCVLKVCLYTRTHKKMTIFITNANVCEPFVVGSSGKGLVLVGTLPPGLKFESLCGNNFQGP